MPTTGIGTALRAHASVHANTDIAVMVTNTNRNNPANVTLNITGGTANLGGANATVTTFTQSGGTLSGTGNLTVSGATTLSGGTMTGSGDTITLGALTISGNLGLDAGRLLDVTNGATWSAGQINFNAGSNTSAGQIVNRAGSLFDNTFNGSMIGGNFGAEAEQAEALVEHDRSVDSREIGEDATPLEDRLL